MGALHSERRVGLGAYRTVCTPGYSLLSNVSQMLRVHVPSGGIQEDCFVRIGGVRRVLLSVQRDSSPSEFLSGTTDAHGNCKGNGNY